MENKKYELVKEDSIVIDGFMLYRIRALRDFFFIKAGDLGGYIENERCLSHEGRCWVYNDAKVYNTGKVVENGHVAHNAVVTHGSTIKGYARVLDNAVVKNYSIIHDDSEVSGKAVVDGSDIGENAKVCVSAYVHNHSIVKGYSVITGNANINDSVIVGSSHVGDNSYVGRGCYLKSIDLLGSITVVGENFLSDLRIGFDVKESRMIASYTDPNNHTNKIAASKVSNQFTTWNANGSIEDIIAAQYSDEEKDKMSKLLQAHMDIYNIQ